MLKNKEEIQTHLRNFGLPIFVVSRSHRINLASCITPKYKGDSSEVWCNEYNLPEIRRLYSEIHNPNDALELCEDLLRYCEGWAKEKYGFEKQVSDLIKRHS